MYGRRGTEDGGHSSSVFSYGITGPGARNGNKNDGWYPTTIRRILHDTAYKGEYRQTYDGEEYRISIPAIVDSALWDRVQERLQDNKQSTRRTLDHYLLARRLRCDHCGRTITTHNQIWRGKKKTSICYYYVCNQKRHDHSACVLPKFRADDLDAFVWDWLIDKLNNPGKLRAEIEAAQAGNSARMDALQSRLAAIEATRAQHKTRLRELVTTAAQSTVASVRSMLDQLVSELDEHSLAHKEVAKLDRDVDVWVDTLLER